MTWARSHRQYLSAQIQSSPAKLAGYSLLVAGPDSDDSSQETPGQA
jgi:hypothetical protein